MSGEESRLSEMLEAGGTAVEIAVALNRRAFPLMRACKGFIESDRSANHPRCWMAVEINNALPGELLRAVEARYVLGA
jgi:hypothetical protein